MKILNIAICFLLFFSINSTRAEEFDWKRLTTKTGKVYRNIQLIDADEYGLLFRHSHGIAKENFWVLSDAIRENFETDEKAAAQKGEGNADAKNEPVNVQIPEIVLTFAIRQPVVPQPSFNSCYHAAYFHPYHPNPVTWPSHWHRFHHAHYLTNPHYRALATRNFLYDTGLIYPFGRMHCRYR